MIKGNRSWLIHGDDDDDDDDVVDVVSQMTMMMMIRKIRQRQLSKITCKTFQYLPCVGGERWRIHDDGDDDDDDDDDGVGNGDDDGVVGGQSIHIHDDDDDDDAGLVGGTKKRPFVQYFDFGGDIKQLLSCDGDCDCDGILKYMHDNEENRYHPP